MNEYKDVRRLMKTAFPRNELIPLWVLNILALRKSINFRAFYDDEQFCGIMYTAENDKYIYVLYLAVNDQIRSKGETYSVMTSDIENFDAKEFESLLSSFSFGTRRIRNE